MKKFTSVLLLLTCFSISSYAQNMFPLQTSDIRINVADLDEVEEFLDQITEESIDPVIFDKIGSGKIEFSLYNDFSPQNLRDGDISTMTDDIGKTHGYKLSVYKNMAPLLNGNDKYYINISYETTLYTNSDQPEVFQKNYKETLYLNSDGYWQADVFFKEENLFKVLLGKVKSKDAYYWKVGVGFHEMNTDDANRGFILSSITQQAWHHRDINERHGPTYREYNYLTQDGSQKGIAIEAELGKDITLNRGKNSRTFTRAGVNSRATMVKDASYVGAYINLGHDYKVVRVQAGISGRVHTDSSVFSESFLEAAYQSKYGGVKLKYTIPITKDPAYTNALPSDFQNRVELATPKENLIWLTFEGRLP